MVVFLYLVGAAVLLFAMYLLALKGRRNAPGLEQLRKWRYAHRGLHGDGKPENSMAAFRAAKDGGFGIEFDLHLLKDGNLGVMHDSNLFRTTGEEGRMEDLTTEDLCRYHLGGTEETIPQFSQVLELFDGKAPLIIELKSVDSNFARLAETACRQLEGYKGPYCLESFDPRVVRWLKCNRPELIRGQLAEGMRKGDSPYPWLLRFGMAFLLSNFWNRPDFIAYDFTTRKNLSVFFCRRLWKITGVSWTIRTKEQFTDAQNEGWIPIFEGFLP